MKTRPIVLAVVLVAALLTGCSGRAPASPEPPEPAGTRTPSEETSEEPSAEEVDVEETEEPAPAEPETNERGNIVKQIGEAGGLQDPATNEWTLDFKVTEIVPNFQCTSEYAEPPVNGQFVALRFEVNTTAAWDSSTMGDFMMTFHDFQAFDANNMRLNDPIGNAYMCLSDAEQLPQTMGPAQSANGTIVLDLPPGAGVVAYRPVYVQSGGWEWTFAG